MDTSVLRAQHRVIIRRASALSGLAARINTRGDAVEAEQMLKAIDKILVEHLRTEDTWLYPSLMAADDQGTRDFAADCFEEMGGILGAWNAYRTQWNADVIFAHGTRFATATSGIVGALAMRVEREDDHLYPAMDRLSAAIPQSRPQPDKARLPLLIDRGL